MLGAPRSRCNVLGALDATRGAAVKVCSIPHSANGRASWPFLLLKPRNNGDAMAVSSES